MNGLRFPAVGSWVTRVSRRLFCLAGIAACAFRAADARADELPATLQVELIAKLAEYDKNMRPRAGDKLVVLVVAKSGNADSEREAGRVADAFGRLERIAGVPRETVRLLYSDGDEMAAACKKHHASIVYVSSALAGDAGAIARALESQSVMTVAPSAQMTKDGIVLGFELVSSRPKLFVNLPQAQKQNVAMAADALKLMTVFR